MVGTIKAVFDKHCVDLKIDNKWIKQVREFDLGFITKNPDHISFFGSGLLGVYPIRWTDDDKNRWLDDILMVDDIALKDDLHELPVIDPTRIVTSDLTNLSFIYVLHRIVSSDLSESVKKEIMVSVSRIMFYKYLSSLLSHYFPYVADESIAKATYNSLSMKFDIKRYGSWGALIQQRSVELTGRSSIHADTIKYMRDDDAILYVISDVQSRIRELVKAITKIFYLVRDSDNRVISTSNVLVLSEGIVVRDVKRTYSQFYRYIAEIASDKTDFIRKDLVSAILSTTPSANEALFYHVLDYVSANFNDKKRKHVKALVEENLLYTFEFLNEKGIKTNDLAQILVRLRAMYTGSRINDNKILSLRALGDKIVKEASPKKSSYPTAPERTALLLYIALRTLAMSNYKS